MRRQAVNRRRRDSHVKRACPWRHAEVVADHAALEAGAVSGMPSARAVWTVLTGAIEREAARRGSSSSNWLGNARAHSGCQRGQRRSEQRRDAPDLAAGDTACGGGSPPSARCSTRCHVAARSGRAWSHGRARCCPREAHGLMDGVLRHSLPGIYTAPPRPRSLSLSPHPLIPQP
ncbi:hypothetical protein L227DRAFT_218680 [Lentinus tigrinus ALCF2SS1-6]|uniref:Uncharacterized protein n=1 Tax=Lentinus tigrinus ALCF2SS1-6 TaxID=1328759 RepID=A0A5C2SPH1_9APHY|nr:hypothetical protein L227DRAFT_218680 [Lentinus tigrinus ALCF2SS1-6]